MIIQPDPGNIDNPQAYASNTRPPETGLAVLAAWIGAYSASQPEVIVLDQSTDRTQLVRQMARADIVGLSDWFTNHSVCMTLAAKIKRLNPAVTIVVGGPNASMLGGLILRNHPAVDCVVGSPNCFDGEEGLRGIVDGQTPDTIPNLWYRRGEKISFTRLEQTDLMRMPLWDFREFQNLEQRLEQYLSNQDGDPWQTSPLTLFSSRGCIKALKEGRCSYCTSAEEGGCRILSPEKFWEQVGHLNRLYGARTFYVADDIFTISKTRIESLALTKPAGVFAHMRAYGYLPYLASLPTKKLAMMAESLRRIGVFNLFYGSEHFDPEVLPKANKQVVSVAETVRVVNEMYKSGDIRSTIAVLVGLPGESTQTLETNLKAIGTILEKTGEAFERLYISYVVPLRGTSLFDQLLATPSVVSEYRVTIGKDLASDDDPDYRLLVKLMIEHLTSVNFRDVELYLERMVHAAQGHIANHKIGGFLLD